MTARKLFLQAAWYYLLLSTIAAVFLFVTTLNSVFDGPAGWQAPWFNESNQVAALFWGIILIDQSIGLFVLILLRRMAVGLSTGYFAFLYTVLFIFFMAPSLFLFIAALSMAGNT
jgi:hypothetical protein